MGHPGNQKMIAIVNKKILCPNLKVDITLFFAKFQQCQLVKEENQHPSGFLQLLPILEWKWEVISIDFIMDLTKRKKQNDSIFA